MTLRVGWITDTFPRRPKPSTVWLRSGAMLTMRCRNPMLYLNRLGFQNSFYVPRAKPEQHYDLVVVVKAFTEAILQEVRRLQAAGVPIIFDANVNYYYIWGDYTDPRTQPTPAARRAATQITRQAAHIIADSPYLRDVVRDFNPAVTWIPDNVLTPLFRPKRRLVRHAERLRLIWSGVAFKGDELFMLRPVFAEVEGLELWLVSDQRPPVIDQLGDVLPIRWFRYSDLNYARLLGRADAIISPRYLNNGYNLGHTEYKITLGMARNLPAVASPQPAYVAAAQHGGVVVCYDLDAWRAALVRLRDDFAYRGQLAAAAGQTVQHYYATSVVARQYAALFRGVWDAQNTITTNRHTN